MNQIADYTIFNLNDPVDRKAAQEAAEIAKHNDAFRVSFGGSAEIPGMIVRTTSVEDMPGDTQAQITSKIMGFTGFDADNDPYGDHSFGSFTVNNQGVETTLFWKIDLYDADYRGGAETPTDPASTRRVLTILQPFEY